MLDAIARRYGLLPHQVLELSPWELTLAAECLRQADATQAQAVERAGMVIPVVVLGGG